MFEQVVEGMSGQVQSSAGLVCVKKVDDIQAKVPLEPLDVRVGAVKYLRTGKKHIQSKAPWCGTNFFSFFYCLDTENI